MQNLYNAMLNGTIEQDDKGNQVVRPPTAIMLRAARMIKQLADTNDTNMLIIQRLERHVDELQELIHSMTDNMMKEANASLRKDGQESPSVEGSGGDSGRRNSTGEGGNKAEGHDPSPH